jgi:protein SCO1/2
MKSTDRLGVASTENFGASRREFLRGLLGAAPAALALPFFAERLAAQAIVQGHGQIKPPEPVPDVALLGSDGASTTFLRMVQGRATAVQLMYTSCTSICPIEAAIFQRVQNKLPDMAARGTQLLSLSVDSQTDSPAALAAWLRRFHAGPSWLAAVSGAQDALRLQDFFGKGSDSGDHSNQVSILDRQGRLVWRTYELPTAEEIIGVLRKL